MTPGIYLDIYHSHLTYGVIFGCLLSVPRLYTHHNIAPRVNKYVYKALCFFIDKQIGISTLCGQMLESFSNRNVTIINNGVDIDKFNAPTVRGWKENGIIDCLCVGAITEQKNYSYLIRVIQLLPLDIRKRLNIVIAGEGTEENTLKIRAEIISADLEHNIRLLGNRTDIVDIMSSVQVFIMSSAWEGLPIALIEATMSGLPCIVTDVGGCKEVIECCKNGIVVDPLDHVEFRDAISYMVTDSSAIKKFSESALYNRHRYSIISSCKKHLDVYNNMLSNYSDD